MFTNCPGCARQFRVRASQLAAAEGLVQCGFCGKQFNALSRLHDRPLLIDRELMAAASAQEELAEPEFSIPEHAEQAREPALQAHASGQEDDAITVSSVAAAATVTQAAEPQAHDRAADKDAEEFDFPEHLLDDEPTLKSSPRARVLWGFGILILLLAGAAQVTWFNRDFLLSRYPQYLPQAKQICQQFNCTLTRNRDISAIKLLNRDVRIHPRYEDALLVNATITNLSSYAQKFPVVLLSLFDHNGEVIAYRQIPPADYLDSSIDSAAGMLPNMPIHFVFEVANSNTDAVSFEFDFL